MTEKELKHYRALKAEIKDMEKRYHYIADTVKGSSKEFPYIEHTILVENDIAYRDSMKNRIVTLKMELLKLEEYIKNIPDPKIRHIFRLRYIDGRSWSYIAREIGFYDASYPRKLKNRYLENKE